MVTIGKIQVPVYIQENGRGAFFRASNLEPGIYHINGAPFRVTIKEGETGTTSAAAKKRKRRTKQEMEQSLNSSMIHSSFPTNHPIVAHVVNNAKKKIKTEMTGGLDGLLGAIARVERDPSVLAKTIASSSGAFPASPRSIPLHPSQHQQNQLLQHQRMQHQQMQHQQMQRHHYPPPHHHPMYSGRPPPPHHYVQQQQQQHQHQQKQKGTVPIIHKEGNGTMTATNPHGMHYPLPPRGIHYAYPPSYPQVPQGGYASYGTSPRGLTKMTPQNPNNNNNNQSTLPLSQHLQQQGLPSGYVPQMQPQMPPHLQHLLPRGYVPQMPPQMPPHMPPHMQSQMLPRGYVPQHQQHLVQAQQMYRPQKPNLQLVPSPLSQQDGDSSGTI